MYKIFRWFVFKLDAEQAHYLTLNWLNFLIRIPFVKTILYWLYGSKPKSINLFGLNFSNAVGLAAGLDKNARYIEALAALGFGHIEVGTVTPLPQSGNDKPRLFRLVKDEAIINRMGFNNDGVDAIKNNILKFKSQNPGSGIIIGGNIGKNKITPNEHAVNDYVICFEKLFDVVDYFVVNVSSPNTPDLRALQDKEPLKVLLSTLQSFNNRKSVRKPLLLKIAPDLSNEQLDDIIEIANDVKLDGIIATNTTISRDHLLTDQATIMEIGAGGLSGKPLSHRSTEVIRYLHQKQPQLPIIASGGIMSATDAKEKVAAGSVLVQLYTGFIYEGPGLIRCINRAIH
jgi:dihydroorotate dehydrogenase